MRAWSGIIRLATVLAPFGILLFWGGSYLLACAEYLANPGVPLRFTYRVPAGDLLVTADSYVLDTKTGDLTVVRPKIANPAGMTLFSADRIEALGLPLLGNETRRAVVTARNAFATIQRRPDGTLDLFDYLPKQEGPSGNFPFAITLDRGMIKFVDSTGPKRFEQLIRMSDIKVDGVGDRWLASGQASLDKVGDITLSVQNEPNSGVWFRGLTDRAEISELYRVFRQTPEGRKTKELQSLDARSLVVKGPFEVFIPSEAGARLQTQVVAEAEGFRYGNDYAADRLNFDGIASADGVQGAIVATNQGQKATFTGLAKWEDGFSLRGDLVATVPSIASLPSPVRKQVPKDIAVQGPISYDGSLAYSETGGWQANGTASAGSLAAYEERIDRPVVLVDYSKTRLALATKSGSWRGADIEGNVAFDNRARGLTGSLRLAGVSLDPLARRFDLEGLQGTGDLDVILTGTLDKPVAFIRADTQNSSFKLAGIPRSPGRFTLAATLRDNKLRFDQAYLVTEAGSISASGTYDIRSQALRMEAVGSGIDLDRLNPELEGIARFKASIGGTLDKPLYQGTAELFGLTIQQQPIPIVTSTFQGDSRSVTAENLKAIKGASQAEGRVSLRFKDMALNGTFQALGVQLSDFLGDDYLASIDLPDARLSGTLSKPTFNANASAKDIVILGSRIDGANAVISYQNNLLQVDDFQVKKGGGRVDGFLSYDAAKRFGQANFTAEMLALEDLLPPDLGANLTAKFSGEAGLTFDKSGFKLGSGEGTLADVRINETDLGTGDWKVSADGKEVRGDVFFGGLATSLDLTGLRYQMDSKQIAGNVWLRNAPLKDLVKMAKPYFPAMDPQLTALLESAQGTLGVSADLSGTVENINIANGGLTAENMTISERPGGTLSAAFDRQGKTWSIDTLSWIGGPVGVNGKGVFTESGDINFTGQAIDADLSYVGIFEPALASLLGKVSSDFSILGTAKSPIIEASIRTNQETGIAFVKKGEAAEKDPKVSPPLDQKPVITNPDDLVKELPKTTPLFINTPEGQPLRLSNWDQGVGGLLGRLGLNYDGYVANLDLALPFQFPFALAPEAPISANLALTPRPIQDIKQLADVFDAAKSEGVVSGQIKVTGTKELIAVNGGIGLAANRLVTKTGDQEFRDAKMDLVFRPQEIQALVSATSSLGGTLNADVLAKVPTLDDIFRQVRANELEALYASSLSGQLKLTDWAANFAIGKDGRASGEIDSTLTLSGDLKNQTIKGNVDLGRATVTMPSEFEGGAGSFALPLAPYFEIALNTTTPAKFRSSTAEMDMVGTGQLVGTMDNLDMDARLRVQKGVLKLPTTRVTVERGGIIHPHLSILNGESTARLDVELQGKTRVVAARGPQGSQRYDVTLDVRGDLLQTGGLTMIATSDPPELSQDEILALLGQADLLQGIASGVQRGDFETEMRNALTSLAVPYLLDPITSRLAASFGLDYLTLEINALEGATIYVARTLSRDLVLQGSRQINQVNSNYPIKYELRLAYQIRVGRGRGDRRRWNFSIGMDELRPWKLGVEYSFRF